MDENIHSVGKIAKKAVLRSVFLLIRNWKYSAILSKYTPTDCFFGDFAHWTGYLFNKFSTGGLFSKIVVVRFDIEIFTCYIW